MNWIDPTGPLAAMGACASASRFRDFKPLLEYLEAGGEIDASIRDLLVTEVRTLAGKPGRKRPRQLPHPKQVWRDYRRIRNILSGTGAKTDDEITYAGHVADLALSLVPGLELTTKGALTRGARAILCNRYGISEATLTRLFAKVDEPLPDEAYKFSQGG